MSTSLWPQVLEHTRLPCPSPIPRAYSNSCPSSWWCHPAITSSAATFSFCPQSFPASGSFLMSQFFTQDIGASALASVLPMSIQGWFTLGWTGLLSLQSKGLSRVFSSTTVQKHQFFSLSLLYGPPPTCVHDYQSTAVGVYKVLGCVLMGCILCLGIERWSLFHEQDRSFWKEWEGPSKGKSMGVDLSDQLPKGSDVQGETWLMSRSFPKFSFSLSFQVMGKAAGVCGWEHTVSCVICYNGRCEKMFLLFLTGVRIVPFISSISGSCIWAPWLCCAASSRVPKLESWHEPWGGGGWEWYSALWMPCVHMENQLVNQFYSFLCQRNV